MPVRETANGFISTLPFQLGTGGDNEVPLPNQTQLFTTLYNRKDIHHSVQNIKHTVGYFQPLPLGIYNKLKWLTVCLGRSLSV